MRSHRTAAVLVALAASLAPSFAAPTAASAGPAAPTAPLQASPTTPRLVVTPVVSGLSNPWDVAFTPDGTMLWTERRGRIGIRLPNGTQRLLNADLSDLWAEGETGLMGIETDPAFASNRRVYTCQGELEPGGLRNVDVVAWSLDPGLTTLTRVNNPLIDGIDAEWGRHGGCQLRIDAQGHLRVGTGDAALGTNPQNRFSLAGKTLRVDRFSGAGVAGNPFIGGGGDPRVFTWGHRNVQGLALRANGQVFSVEHGPDRDDEVNLLSGGNHGWNPVPGYNESVPMTAPGAQPAVWTSGSFTIAPSGATFLRGSQWGGYDGMMAMSVLAHRHLRLLSLDGNGNLLGQLRPPELDGTYGRLRGAEMGPDGNLYLTTDNGSGDLILRVTPQPIESVVHLRSSATPGPPATSFAYGTPGYAHLLCNFDGVGGDGIVAFDRGSWYIRSTATPGPPEAVISYGAAGYVPVCGDWNGDGIDGIGVYVNGTWYRRDSASPGPPQYAFAYGIGGYTPVVGNWDGAGGDGIGVFTNGNWFLRQAPSAGSPQLAYSYGIAGYVPVVGNWDGAGGDGTGVFVNGNWYLRETPSPGAPQRAFAYGGPGYRPLVGDHDDANGDGSGVVVP
jgi:glucose/arabinose dehydrogenase